jgi:beta-1,4-mannosyl-glycoprotein beta-1,4-N-acetylglucosaminyltransferase
MNKIYDTFIFFNELDLLEIRLNILNNYVDYFVLVESTKTFTGIPKPLYYLENKERFKYFENKIIHVIVDDMPDSFDLEKMKNGDSLQDSILHDCLTTPNVPKNEVHWLREFYQKECVKKGLITAKDDDFIFISDLDEIWDPNIKLDLNFNGNYRLNQKVFTYFLNLQSSEHWYGTVATKYSNIKNYSINHIRTPNRNEYLLIENAGWHFTFQGGEKMVREKIESYGHQEHNNEFIKNSIKNKIQNNLDVFNRGFTLTVTNNFLPLYITNNVEKYKHMIK